MSPFYLLSFIQDALSTLQYIYSDVNNEEPLLGNRVVTITVFDGAFEASINLTVTVVILNNNPPEVSLRGDSRVVYLEGSEVYLPIGNIFQPGITDADNNDVFPMEGAVVRLLRGVDGESSERIEVPAESVVGLTEQGIMVEGKVQKGMFRTDCYCAICSVALQLLRIPSTSWVWPTLCSTNKLCRWSLTSTQPKSQPVEKGSSRLWSLMEYTTVTLPMEQSV